MIDREIKPGGQTFSSKQDTHFLQCTATVKKGAEWSAITLRLRFRCPDSGHWFVVLMSDLAMNHQINDDSNREVFPVARDLSRRQFLQSSTGAVITALGIGTVADPSQLGREELYPIDLLARAR